jgi:putative copper resistance protein D
VGGLHAIALLAVSQGVASVPVSMVHLVSVWLAVVSDSAYALVIGTLLAGGWLGASSDANVRLLRRLLLSSVVVLILAHLVHPWFLAASMSGSDDFGVNLRIVPMMLSSTHQGVLWYVNSAGLAVLLAVTLAGRVRKNTLWIAVTLVSLLLIAFAKAASGHAGDEGDFGLLEVCQLLHILATGIWSGAILVSGFAIIPRLFGSDGLAALWSYAGSLSKTVTWALGVLIVSGIYASDKELNNSLAALGTSTWGKILLIKLAFVGAAVVLGAMNRMLSLQRPATEERSLLLKRLLFTEALLMGCILCLSGLLGTTAPPMSDM